MRLAADLPKALSLQRRRCSHHGAAYTIFSEWPNVEIRRSWSYTTAMLVLPWLGTGLMPLLQWLIVPGLALAIIGYRYRGARRPVR